MSAKSIQIEDLGANNAQTSPDRDIEVRRQHFLDTYRQERDGYQRFADYVLGQIASHLRSQHIAIAYSSARAKEIESLKAKCRKAKYTDFHNEIMDMAGVRIVTYLLQDVPSVQKIVEEQFNVRREDSQDKLELLGANKIGYLSVHYIVTIKDENRSSAPPEYLDKKCEVQIRTVLEDAWAQIFHDRQYKSESLTATSDKLERRTNLIAGSLELLDHVIDELVGEYDRDQQERNGKLLAIMDKPITRENLCVYLDRKLGRKVQFFDFELMQRLLNAFNVKRVRQFDHLLDNTREAKRFQMYEGILTADKIISCVLIITNDKTFFENGGKEVAISKEIAEFLNVVMDIRTICDRYGVEID